MLVISNPAEEWLDAGCARSGEAEVRVAVLSLVGAWLCRPSAVAPWACRRVRKALLRCWA